MNAKLLEPEIQQFIVENTERSVEELALQKNPFSYIEWPEVLNQIAARKKAKEKLPTWYDAENILYPSKISIEQTSSETAARYKSALVRGKNLIDLTGGFGIDDYYFAKKVDKVAHCEQNLELSAIAAHNFSILQAANIQILPGDSIDALTLSKTHWDWIYIDPSRRNDAKGKVFLLKDCLPDVPGLLDTYFQFSNNILIKTAPILDITAGLTELHSVREIHIVALNNEVKELLWILEKGFEETPMLTAVNITNDSEEVFEISYGSKDEPVFGLPSNFLYEPNSAIMKSGAFNAICHHYGVNKLHPHSHLYTSGKLADFPGRRFQILDVFPYNKQDMKAKAENRKMNVTARNFPLQVKEIRQKWKIKDGGDTYAFFTTNRENEKIVVLCSKI